MRLELLMFCILMFQIGFVRCTDGDEPEKKANSIKRRKVYKYSQPSAKREFYEQVHQEKYQQCEEKLYTWPILNNKSAGELTNICEKLALCTKVTGWISSVYPEIGVLNYTLKASKSITMIMLRCKIGKNVIRFIDGTENYIAFMVLPNPSNINNVHIVAACPRSLLPDMEADLQTKKHKREYYEEALEKLFEYETIHQNKYGTDFDKYKSWPLVENKSPQELSNIVAMLAMCVGIDGLVEYMDVKVEQRHMRYSIREYKPRSVKMLSCYRQGGRSFYFIDGAGDYKSFLVIRKGLIAKENLFITAACATDILPNSVNIDPSSEQTLIIPKLEVIPKSDNDGSGPSTGPHIFNFFKN